MPSYFKVLIFILLCSSEFSIFAQDDIISVSSDNQYIAILQKQKRLRDTIYIKDTTNYNTSTMLLYDASIEIYEPSTGNNIQILQLKTKRKNKVTSAFFSKNKFIFCVNDQGTKHVWNVPSGKKIKTVEADTIILSNIANSFYAQKNNRIIKHSYYYNTSKEYKIPEDNPITKIGITSDDKFLLAKGNEDKIYIWNIRSSNDEITTIFGEDFSTDDQGNFFISKYYKGTVNISKFNAETNDLEYNKERNINSKTYVKPSKVIKRKVKKDQSEFSPDGKYYTYTWRQGFSKNITTINLQTGTKVYETKKDFKKYNKTTPYFYNDSICMLQKDDKTVSIFDLNTNKVIDEVSYSKKIEPSQILFDQKAVAIIDENRKILAVKDEENIKEIEGYIPIKGLNNTNEFYFAKNKKNELEYFPVKNIMNDSSNLVLEEPKKKNLKIKQEFQKFRLDTNSYVSINDLSHVSKAKDTTTHLVVKSVQIGEDFTGLQFYVLDDNNNFYYGISEENWQNVICGVTIENEYGEIMPIDDYQIMEYSEKQGTPVAMCFVLDHSGSMGTTNATLMQQGLLSLANKVKGNEGIAIVKFDEDIETTVEMTGKTSTVAKEFEVKGLDGFGGATALLDGINQGLDVLIESDKYQNKALVVLTDGYENSSSSTKNQVLLKAMQNNIGIYAIGYGSNIDVEFLKSISTNTSGGYYWINNNNMFDDVFEDVYKNMKNYYTINFNTPYPGLYKIKLELCLEDSYDSVVYYFDNYVPNILFTNERNEYDSLFEVITGIGDTITLDNFNSYKIYKDIQFVEYKKEFDSIIFPDIKFYFDETRIVEGTDKELINVINFMKKYPQLRIEIQGHTDSKGGLLYNEKLSQARAEKVRQIMVDAGIEAQRIRTIGYGETKPIDTNDTDEGRQENRRVEFLLIK
ncbi:MAG: OmpA family protein [Bacteroidales bacterium]|nr:OmpA family protein [Bacteroidales bacterium]